MPPKTKKGLHRSAALQLLRSGALTPGEIARALGESRQIVHGWLKESGVDWKQRHELYVERRVRRALKDGG